MEDESGNKAAPPSSDCCDIHARQTAAFDSDGALKIRPHTSHRPLMKKSTFKLPLGLAVAGLLAMPALFAGDKDASPLTPEIKAKLRVEVVTIVAEGFLKPEGVARVKSEGPAYIAKSRKEPGCIQYQLQFDATDPGHIFWYEQYASAAAFETHVTSSYSKAWVAMLEPLSTKPIVIHFLNKIEHVAD